MSSKNNPLGYVNFPNRNNNDPFRNSSSSTVSSQSGPVRMNGKSHRRNSESETEDEDSMEGLFHKFCSSSTIHGTYFWTATRSLIGKVFWMAMVFGGITMAAFLIKSSFAGWQDNPVITSVAQISIEEVPFPAITICPTDNTKYGFLEHYLNSAPEQPPPSEQRELFLELLRQIHAKMRHTNPDDCLKPACHALLDANVELGTDLTSLLEDDCSDEGDQNDPGDCPMRKDFYRYVREVNVTVQANTYDDFVAQEIEKLVDGVFGPKADRQQRRRKRDTTSKCQIEIVRANCTTFIKDFRFLRDAGDFLAPLSGSGASLKDGFGTRVRLLLTLLEDFPEEQYMVYRRFIIPDKYPEAYTCTNKVTPVPELVNILSNRGEANDEGNQWMNRTSCDLAHVTSGNELTKVMKLSTHPPHALEDDSVVSSPAFPYCSYNSDDRSGIAHPAYNNSRFCNDFQTTFNEYGLCYTYNNVRLAFEKGKDPHHDGYSIRGVAGCGKERGLRMVLDNHRIMRLDKSNNLSGFRVFITVPGVVTSKVPFTVDPTFRGQYSFFLHGIHVIKTSQAFREWNQQAKVCHFPEDRNVTLFPLYSQDNCLLECRLKKLSATCGCSPWYVEAATDLPLCDPEGARCLREKFKSYRDDLVDRKECSCLNDCEMVHFFYTGVRQDYASHHADLNSQMWLDEEAGVGKLADYLLDPENVFTDSLSKSALLLAHGERHWSRLARRRFDTDIAVVNFFFDTPIITQINLELRTNVFDMISAVGGTLGLFTGISVITFVEILYWMGRFTFQLMRSGGYSTLGWVKQTLGISPKISIHDVGHGNALEDYERRQSERDRRLRSNLTLF